MKPEPRIDRRQGLALCVLLGMYLWCGWESPAAEERKREVGHFHRNWAQEDFRKLVLNAIVWAAGMEVPRAGVPPGKVE